MFSFSRETNRPLVSVLKPPWKSALSSGHVKRLGSVCGKTEEFVRTAVERPLSDLLWPLLAKHKRCIINAHIRTSVSCGMLMIILGCAASLWYTFFQHRKYHTRWSRAAIRFSVCANQIAPLQYAWPAKNQRLAHPDAAAASYTFVIALRARLAAFLSPWDLQPQIETLFVSKRELTPFGLLLLAAAAGTGKQASGKGRNWVFMSGCTPPKHIDGLFIFLKFSI